MLDEAATARCGENATLRVEIKAHLQHRDGGIQLGAGDRRANGAITDQPRITADWLRSVSYGEERPKYDNCGPTSNAARRSS